MSQSALQRDGLLHAPLEGLHHSSTTFGSARSELPVIRSLAHLGTIFNSARSDTVFPHAPSPLSKIGRFLTEKWHLS